MQGKWTPVLHSPWFISFLSPRASSPSRHRALKSLAAQCSPHSTSTSQIAPTPSSWMNHVVARSQPGAKPVTKTTTLATSRRNTTMIAIPAPDNRRINQNQPEPPAHHQHHQHHQHHHRHDHHNHNTKTTTKKPQHDNQHHQNHHSHDHNTTTTTAANQPQLRQIP